MNRKDPRNFGTELEEQQPPEPIAFAAAAGRYSTAMPERVVLALLRQEVDRLVLPENELLLRKFFEHFYAPLVSESELDSYVSSFLREPPITLLGYPRTNAKFPCYAVVLEREEESDEALGQYLGQTQPGEPDIDVSEYTGTVFTQVLGIYAYAEHPDQALYCYHLAKSVLISSNNVLHQLGLIDPHYGGGDLAPAPDYLPENMFVRRLELTAKALFTVPGFLSPDPARVRVAGVFAHDVVVSGMRGGVKVEGEDGC